MPAQTQDVSKALAYSHREKGGKKKRFYDLNLHFFHALSLWDVITDLKLPEITDIFLPFNLYTKGFTPARVWSTKLNTRQGEPSEQGEEYVIGENLARTRCKTT